MDLLPKLKTHGMNIKTEKVEISINKHKRAI